MPLANEEEEEEEEKKPVQWQKMSPTEYLSERRVAASFSAHKYRINLFAKGIFFQIFQSEAEILMRNVNGQKMKKVTVPIILYH